MKKLLLILILIMMPAISITAGHARDVGIYNVEELTSEEGDSGKKPFTITGIEQQRGETVIWIRALYGGIAGVAKKVSAGELQAQISDDEGGTDVTLSLNREVTCTDASGSYAGTYRLGYSTQLPAACATVTSTRYYLLAPVVFGLGRDLGIGLEPDYLWLIEIK